MPTRDRIAHSSVPSTLEAIGDGWTLSLLMCLLNGPRRFEELTERLGIPRSTLSTRLRHLVAHGLVEAQVYRERPTRYVYALSRAGLALLPVLALSDAFDVTHAGVAPSLWHADLAGDGDLARDVDLAGDQDPAGGQDPAGDQDPAAGQRDSPGDRDLAGDQDPAGHPLVAVAVCAACGEAVRAHDVTARYPDAVPGASVVPRKARGRGRATRARSIRKPLGRARDVLEDAWAAKVVAALFMGEQRFTDLVDATQAAPNIVSERLQRLTDARLVQGGPAYQLTARGLALYPLVVALIAYGDARRGHPSLTLTHRCGAALRLRLACAGGCEGSVAVEVLPESVSFAMQASSCTTPTRT